MKSREDVRSCVGVVRQLARWCEALELAGAVRKLSREYEGMRGCAEPHGSSREDARSRAGAVRQLARCYEGMELHGAVR